MPHVIASKAKQSHASAAGDCFAARITCDIPLEDELRDSALAMLCGAQTIQ